MADVPVVIRLLAQRDATVDRNLGGLKKLMDEIAGLKKKIADTKMAGGDTRKLEADLRKATAQAKELEQSLEAAGRAAQRFGKAALAGVGVVTATLTGIGAGAVVVAGQFEQLEAKLVTILKSSSAASESFAAAVEFAAKTPFDVKGVVSATVQLEVYGQKAEAVLPRVANLAAGMGRSLDETALVVGKALSGSLEGFESLRNTYGISNTELARYGAKLSETGGIALKSATDIDKAKQALLAIIDLRFGGAIERQAKTFQGALSNAGDAVTNLAAGFGKALLPAVTTVLRGFSDLVSAVDKGLSPTTKGIIAFGGAAVVAFGTVTVAAGVTTLAIVALDAELVKLSEHSALASGASTLLSGALGRVSTVAATLGTSLTAFALSPVGLTLAGIGAIAGLAAYKIHEMEQSAIDAGQALDEESKVAQDAATTFRQYRNVLNEAGKAHGVFVGTSADVATQAKEIANAFKSIPAPDLARAFSRSGLGAAELKKSLEDLESRANPVRREMAELADQIRQLEIIAAQQANSKNASGAGGVVSKETQQALDEANDKYRRLLKTFQDLGNARNILRQALGLVDDFNAPLNKAAEDAKRLDGYLKFAGRTNDIKSLTAALREVESQLNKNASVPGLAGPRETLQARLLDPSISAEEKAAVEAQLSLMNEQVQLQDKIADATKKAQTERVKAIELALRNEKALRKLSLDEELQYLARALEAAKGNAEEETRIREQIRERKKAARDKELSDAQKALQAEVTDARTSVEELQASGSASAAQTVDALDTVLERLRLWGQANQKLIDQHPELKKSFDAAVRNTGLERIREQARASAENLQILRDLMTQFGVQAVGSAQKLDAVERSIALVKQAQATGAITQKAAEQELLNLSNQKLALERQITNEKRAQQSEIQSLELQNLDQEIQILEARKSAGENVEKELEKARKARLQAALDAIDTEYQAEVAAGKDATLAAEKAGLKRQQVLKQETLRQYQEINNQTNQLRTGLQKQADIRSSFGGSGSSGGGFSPSALPNFADNFGVSSLRRSSSGTSSSASKFSQIQNKVGLGATKPTGPSSLTSAINDIYRNKAARDKAIREGKTPPPPAWGPNDIETGFYLQQSSANNSFRRSYGVDRPGASPTKSESNTFNISVNVDGATITGDEKTVLTKLGKRLSTEKLKRGPKRK